jgi:hypothetical protein
MPTRLLDLNTHMQEDPSIIRLLSVSGGTDYVALGYCWGGDQPLKLLDHKLDQMYSAIEMKALSATIRDEIRVSRTLGIHFLWVASLCIIQDDKEDTAREIDRMFEIYQGALVTTSAAIAASTDQGFLGIRQPIPQFQLPVRTWDKRIGKVLMSEYGDILGSLHPLEPIESRAWTLQEHILSTRILYYGSQQLQWICRNERLSDGGWILSPYIFYHYG